MMHIDPDLNARARSRRFGAARLRLTDRLLAQPQAAGLSAPQRDDFIGWLNALWAEAEVMEPDHAVTLQRYVLIQMTRHRWQGQPLLAAYAARMIGTPSDDWQLRDGVDAVYRNIVAARFLAPEMAGFMEQEARA